MRWKLNVLIGIILLLSISVFDGLSVYRERQWLITAHAKHLGQLAEHLAWMVQNARGQNAQDLVMNYERGLNGNGDHDYRALVLNARSEVIAATNPQWIGAVMGEEKLSQGYEKLALDGPINVFVNGTSRMMASLPMSVHSAEAASEGDLLTIVISGSLDDVRASVNASLITHTFHLVITVLAMMLVIDLALSRFVLRPVRNLLTGMDRMQRGAWGSDLPVRSNDEMGELTRGYNALGRNLERTVRRLVRAEKLASVALAAIYLNRELRKPIELIRGSARFLCQHNVFDKHSAHAAGCIFDQTDKMGAIAEKFDRDFSAQLDDGRRCHSVHSNNNGGNNESVSQAARHVLRCDAPTGGAGSYSGTMRLP
ncbi:MAG: HAMP domain-containing protein [Acidobacteria bacterium]|nr:HAMP domain-containing protein [Acidobacteriota bacterium]